MRTPLFAGKGNDDYLVNKGRAELSRFRQFFQGISGYPADIITLLLGVITPGPSERAKGPSFIQVQGF